jgi:hypothetical protein
MVYNFNLELTPGDFYIKLLFSIEFKHLFIPFIIYVFINVFINDHLWNIMFIVCSVFYALKDTIYVIR